MTNSRFGIGIDTGDTFTHIVCFRGGNPVGGKGPPSKRSREQALADVHDGKINEGVTAEVYEYDP